MSLRESLSQTNIAKEPSVDFTVRGVKVHAAESEKETVEKLFDSLAKIPTGQKAIDNMAKYQTEFSLESSLGKNVGFFEEARNRIVLSKSAGMDFMQAALVHEARHLYQSHNGRKEVENRKLDAASKLMINRATEADAQTEALQACLEWQATGDKGPMEAFSEHCAPITDAYAKNHSLSDAFKGWYDDERITAAYERDYDIDRNVGFMSPFWLKFLGDERNYVSAKPEDIAKFCGGDRVDGFGDFLDSSKARQVHLLTKTVMEMQDAGEQAFGGKSDSSIQSLPVRALKGNPAAQMNAEKLICATREKFNLNEAAKDNSGTNPMTALAKAVDAVEKINKAVINGTVDAKAEAELKTAKKAYVATVDPHPHQTEKTDNKASGGLFGGLFGGVFGRGNGR